MPLPRAVPLVSSRQSLRAIGLNVVAALFGHKLNFKESLLFFLLLHWWPFDERQVSIVDKMLGGNI